jgi:hypothetical protein
VCFYFVIREVEEPVIVCLRSSCNRATAAGGRQVCESRAEGCYAKLWRLCVIMQVRFSVKMQTTGLALNAGNRLTDYTVS